MLWGAGTRALPAAGSGQGGLQPAGPTDGSGHRLRTPFPLAACGRSGLGAAAAAQVHRRPRAGSGFCRSAAPCMHARPPAAARAPGPPAAAVGIHPENRSPRDPASLGVTLCILPSLCPSRYRLPPLPRRQPEPSPGHQDAPTAVPGGRGSARRSPRQLGQWPERWQRGGECRGGGTHQLCGPAAWAGMWGQCYRGGEPAPAWPHRWDVSPACKTTPPPQIAPQDGLALGPQDASGAQGGGRDPLATGFPWGSVPAECSVASGTPFPAVTPQEGAAVQAVRGPPPARHVPASHCARCPRGATRTSPSLNSVRSSSDPLPPPLPQPNTGALLGGRQRIVTPPPPRGLAA